MSNLYTSKLKRKHASAAASTKNLKSVASAALVLCDLYGVENAGKRVFSNAPVAGATVAWSNAFQALKKYGISEIVGGVAPVQVSTPTPAPMPVPAPAPVPVPVGLTLGAGNARLSNSYLIAAPASGGDGVPFWWVMPVRITGGNDASAAAWFSGLNANGNLRASAYVEQFWDSFSGHRSLERSCVLVSVVSGQILAQCVNGAMVAVTVASPLKYVLEGDLTQVNILPRGDNEALSVASGVKAYNTIWRGVLSGSVLCRIVPFGAGSNALQTVVLASSGLFSDALIPVGIPAPAPVPVPVPVPTPTPTPTPTTTPTPSGSIAYYITSEGLVSNAKWSGDNGAQTVAVQSKDGYFVGEKIMLSGQHASPAAAFNWFTQSIVNMNGGMLRLVRASDFALLANSVSMLLIENPASRENHEEFSTVSVPEIAFLIDKFARPNQDVTATALMALRVAGADEGLEWNVRTAQGVVNEFGAAYASPCRQYRFIADSLQNVPLDDEYNQEFFSSLEACWEFVLLIYPSAVLADWLPSAMKTMFIEAV